MRVLAVADIYEALTARRPYREPLAPAAALSVIEEDVPGRLDGKARTALEGYVTGTAGAATQAA